MKPILGITMGDPSGNGPEISVKALMDPKIYDKCRPVIVGARGVSARGRQSGGRSRSADDSEIARM